VGGCGRGGVGVEGVNKKEKEEEEEREEKKRGMVEPCREGESMSLSRGSIPATL
jgi:hypothetical protein